MKTDIVIKEQVSASGTMLAHVDGNNDHWSHHLADLYRAIQERPNRDGRDWQLTDGEIYEV